MARSKKRPPGPLKTRLVLLWNKSIWVKTVQLPFAPFPGLGIRVDVYDLLTVDNVVVGDFGFDATCICRFEGSTKRYTIERVRSFGFEEGGYP
jgi:hypothetical protein